MNLFNTNSWLRFLRRMLVIVGLLKKLIFPFKLFILEIKRDYTFRKTLDNKKTKAAMLGAMGQLCIALFGLVMLYYYVIYAIGGVIYIIANSSPIPSTLIITIIMIPIMFLIIWAWTSFCKKILIKNKRAYLKKEGLYEQYKESTKHIEELIEKK